MTVDRYTKVVLTVIAVCLMWLSLGGPSLITPVGAQANAQRVVLAGWADAKGTVWSLPLYGGPSHGNSGLPVWQINP